MKILRFASLLMPVLALLSLNQACVSPKTVPSLCQTRLRAVIDMGSGSTKMTMAQHSTCSGSTKIEQDHSRPVALEAAKNSDGQIPPEARAAAIAALKELRETALAAARQRGWTQIELAIVATHALRTAANREDFLREIEIAGFSIRALTQDEEARAGYHAVMSSSALPEGCTEDTALVWDVGGGSAQLTRKSPTATSLSIINITSGAESFRAKTLKFKSSGASCVSSTPDSPNPLGKNWPKARALAAQEAPSPKMFSPKTSALMTSKTCVIGIGGVHNKAVAEQLRRNWRAVAPCACGQRPNCQPTPEGYRKKELECLIDHLAAKTDCDEEIKGPYAKTSVSNLALVLGYMDKLGIERVHTRPINMGDFYLMGNLTGAEGLKFKVDAVK